MTSAPQILCIGSVLWDIVGRSKSTMQLGYDVPGNILRLPGGVAMNIAMALNSFGMKTALLSAVGQDAEGEELLNAAAGMGLITSHVHRFSDRPTDRYMAIEGENGLIAAIADAHALEDAGDKILTALTDGSLGTAQDPWTGPVVLDGNLTKDLLGEIASGDMFKQCDLRIAPASPGKAARLLPFLDHNKAMLYVNLIEANTLCDAQFEDSSAAALALLDKGVARVFVTNGANAAAEGTRDRLQTLDPPRVDVVRITGAGDVCMASHIAAEYRGQDPQAAFLTALQTTADYISCETPL